MDPDAQVVLMNYREDGVTPYMIFWRGKYFFRARNQKFHVCVADENLCCPFLPI